MYSFLLALHSLVRWLVLLSLLTAIFIGFRGWIQQRKFSKFDNFIRHTTATIAHIQLLIGIWLYCISPVVAYFLQHFREAVHERQIRFFGMEHITVMVIAIVVITIGSAKAKRKQTDKEKFKTIAIWFSAGLLLIITSVPWEFSPLTSGPYFRAF